MWRQFSLSLGFKFSFFVFFSHFPNPTGYISTINKGVNNTPWHDLYQECFFWYTSINIISEWYPPIYEFLIAMACYLYTISTYFEEQTKLKTRKKHFDQYISLDKTQWIVDMNIIIYDKLYKNGCVCTPQKLGIMRATEVMVVLVRLSSKLPKSIEEESTEVNILETDFTHNLLEVTIVRYINYILNSEVPGSSTIKYLCKIFQFFSFREFSQATSLGVWTVFDLWIFEEWTNERITQDTGIIFEYHFEVILFAPKRIKI